MRQPNPNILPEHARKVWDTARSSAGSECVVTARCKLITPMFGGGVKPGEVDCEMPIRASALRGQLRFWWRLLYGAGKKPADLFDAESKLWGGISREGPRASRVTLQVKSAIHRGPGNLSARSAGDPVSDQLVPKSRLDFPAYALILERGEDPELLQAGYSFELVLRFKKTAIPRQQEEVLEALRWWASFAGVGARTRRGLGAVKVASDDVGLTPVTAEEVEARGGWMVTGQPEGNNPVKAWKSAVETLQRFRQGAGVGRNPGQGTPHPGRSRWPEADAIRRLTRTHAPAHKPEHPVDGFYPRASFGLPLVFHFKDKHKGDPKGKDRDNLVLNPDRHERSVSPQQARRHDNDDPSDRDKRMASPLILRPWFDGRQYRPVALLLPDWKERLSVHVCLDPAGAKTPAPAWPEDPDERKRLAARIKPMHDQGADDALSAFMNFFQESLAGRER